MATIDIDFENLKQDLKKPNLSVEELEEILFTFGFDIDSYENDILKVDITAERIDLLSYTGFLRALKLYLNIDKAKEYVVHKSDLTININKNLENIRPYTVCAVVKGINLTNEFIKEIIWAQEKLHQTFCRKRKSGSIGIYPLDKISFPISFLAEKPEKIKFIPLGETKEMSGEQILKEHSTGKEYAHLLESYKEYPIFLDSNNNILSMPPIINSLHTGQVTTHTTDIFIECSGNNFSKVNQLLNILCSMFSDFGGNIFSLTLNYEKTKLSKKIVTPDLSFKQKTIKVDFINNVLGTNLNVEKIVECLLKLGYICEKFDNNEISLKIPPYRVDILHDVDIADDVIRAYGMSNIKLKEPKFYSFGKKLNTSILKQNIVSCFTNMGVQEVTPFSLSSYKEMFENFNIDGKNHLSLGYTKDKSVNIVVSWLMPKLLKILTNNQHMTYPQKIFTCDYIVEANDKEDVKSKTNLHISYLEANSKINFNDTSSILLSLCEAMGWTLELKEKEYAFYIKGRSGEIIINKKSCGHIGELCPKVLSNFNYFMPTTGFEIDLSLLNLDN